MFDEATVGTGISQPETDSESQKTELITLKGNISSSESVYRLHLQSDGTGKILYSGFLEDFEDFDHEIEIEKLAVEVEEAIQAQITLQSQDTTLDSSEIEEIRQETITEMLTEVFWEQINQTLEDPFFRSFDDDIWGEEFRCEQGTVEELTEFLKLCLLTEREIAKADDCLIVEAETEIDPAGLSDFSYQTERLDKLVEIACGYYQPQGFTYDYNDGCYDRMSGYCMNSETISISLEEFNRVPTRQKMLGMKELRKQLFKMNVPADKVIELTSF